MAGTEKIYLHSKNSQADETFKEPEIVNYTYEKLDGDSSIKPKFSFQHLYETPQQYIDALSQRIPLNDLYEVKDCFCDNAANDYCAVTLEVINPELRKVFGVKDGDRILKVFNKKGDLVYQRAIEPIKQEHLKFAENSKYEGLKAINS